MHRNDHIPFMLRRMYDKGMVDFTQKRIEKGFAYIAQFRYKPAKIDPANTFKEAGL